MSLEYLAAQAPKKGLGGKIKDYWNRASPAAKVGIGIGVGVGVVVNPVSGLISGGASYVLTKVMNRKNRQKPY